MTVAAVQLSSVRKTFGPTIALDGANLKAYTGEVHAIIGGNGSGKSTLAKVISGVLIPDSGQVSVFGRAATSPREARSLGIANVFQEVLVVDECSVLDNLYLGADDLFSSTLSYEQKRDRGTEVMQELLGFDLDVETPVGELPLSIKQTITIARALLADPKVLILDESSAALDFESTERLFKKMRQLKTRGASIMIVTHRIAELVRIADRATVLRDGVDVGCLEKDEITESRILALIAGAERQVGRLHQSIPQKQGVTPVLTLDRGRLWPNAAPMSFSLCPGEIVGVTGLDGQGQSDFVRCLAGVQQLISGQIRVSHGKTSEQVTDLRSARDNGVSYVSGDRKKEGIFPNLSIFENLLLPVFGEYRLGGILNLVNRTKVTPVFEWEASKLSVKMASQDSLITSLSGGNQQKVLIARAFAEKPVVLVLNDPARGIDIAAKLDLYRNLKDFAASGNAVVFLSSEIEEFLDLCTRVHVFRNGAMASLFEPPYDSHVILNAMFGHKATAALPGEALAEEHVAEAGHGLREISQDGDGRPMPRPLRTAIVLHKEESVTAGLSFSSPAIAPGQIIPDKFAELNKVSPPLSWSNVPVGTRSFAIAMTDPDLPEEFKFPRSFAHWLVYDIPAHIREMPEGASQSAALPHEARELNSDFVTFNIPGFGRGYGGPWPPDRQHRYTFTLYALKVDRVDLAEDADLPAFYAAVSPVAIDTTSFIAVYGPAKKPLPAQA